MKLYAFKYFSLITFISLILVACGSKINTQTEVTTLLETSESWDGSPLPAYSEGKPKVTILKFVIPPKTKLEMHKHSIINAGVLLEGELTVITERNDTLQLKAGETISEVVGTWHYGVNSGTEPAEIIVFYAGIEDKANTVIKDVK